MLVSGTGNPSRPFHYGLAATTGRRPPSRSDSTNNVVKHRGPLDNLIYNVRHPSLHVVHGDPSVFALPNVLLVVSLSNGDGRIVS